MEKEYLIKKWLDNNLSEEESKAFQAMDNAELYVEIIQEAERFNGELSAKVKPLETIENKIFIKNTPVLNWLQIASRIAAIFIIGIPVFMLLDKDKINTYKGSSCSIVTLMFQSLGGIPRTVQISYLHNSCYGHSICGV